MQVVIMAGGKGTRISSVNSEVPKPMIKIAGKPILEYQINMMERQGIKKIIIVVGHKSDIIREYFRDGSGKSPCDGKPFGVSIEYIIEESPLGTAGALYFLKDKIKEDCLLVNGDIIFDIDLERFYSFHKEKNAAVTLFTHPNGHPYDSAIIDVDDENRVIAWYHKEDEKKWHKNRVNAGIHLIGKEFWKLIEKMGSLQQVEKIDLDRELLKPLIPTGKIFAYDSPEYVKDMGTPERYFAVSKDIENGLVKNKNLSHKQKAIFIDRDGTLNKYVGFLKDTEQLELSNNAGKAVKKINESGYLAIVITNQPVIARGDITESKLKEIHNKMETLLGQEGAYLDHIYVCPHHPDKGFVGEREELKIVCTCRKPEPGLLLKAKDDFNLDLEQSWMIGDSVSDIEAGKKAGTHTILIKRQEKSLQDFENIDLLSAVETILGK